MSAGLTFPWPDPPAPGQPVEIAPGLIWLRLPLNMRPDHVNALVLDDGDGWTVVDPGLDTPDLRALWDHVLAGPLAGRPVRRVVVTHHHPDHVGLAARLAADGAEIAMPRTAWLLARMLTLDVQEKASDAAVAFWRRAGLPAAEIARRRAERPYNFADMVGLLPPTYTRLTEGATIRMAGADWTIRMGDGHAPEHATFWSGDIVIGGDQVLPTISPNLGVWPTEPEADPVGEWLASCARLAAHARDDQLVLPGHGLPYRGLPFRLRQMIGHHEAALDRLAATLDRPVVALDCFGALFARPIGAAEFGLALAETVGHLNRLRQEGRVTRQLSPDGAWLWQRVARA